MVNFNFYQFFKFNFFSRLATIKRQLTFNFAIGSITFQKQDNKSIEKEKKATFHILKS